MPDTADHIGDLNPDLPAAPDPLADSDDEMRTIKRALTNDFGGITGPVYEDADTSGAGGSTLVTQTTMSSWEARIKASEDAIIGITAGALPLGCILLWYGSIGTIPAGWALCDGRLANGLTTPDLTDRFVVGAGDAFAVNQTGGSESGTTDTAGAHNHGGSVSSTALTLAQLPDLSGLNVEINSDYIANDQGDSHNQQDRVAGGRNVASQFTSLPARISGGGGQTHNHTLTEDGDHAHTVPTVPPYYALAYIMFVGN